MLTITQFYSPADVRKQVQAQFEYLFSLSKQKEYVQLVKQAGHGPVGEIFLVYCQVTYFD